MPATIMTTFSTAPTSFAIMRVSFQDSGTANPMILTIMQANPGMYETIRCQPSTARRTSQRRSTASQSTTANVISTTNSRHNTGILKSMSEATSLIPQRLGLSVSTCCNAAHSVWRTLTRYRPLIGHDSQITVTTNPPLSIVITSVAETAPTHTERPEEWLEVLGFIERNGEDFGVTNQFHEQKISELEEDHVGEVNSLTASHEDTLQALSTKSSKEKKALEIKNAILQRAHKRVNGQLADKESQLQNRDAEIVQLMDQVKDMEGSLMAANADNVLARSHFADQRKMLGEQCERLVVERNVLIVNNAELTTNNAELGYVLNEILHREATLERRLSSSKESVDLLKFACDKDQEVINSLKYELCETHEAYKSLSEGAKGGDSSHARMIFAVQQAENSYLQAVGKNDFEMPDCFSYADRVTQLGRVLLHTCKEKARLQDSYDQAMKKAEELNDKLLSVMDEREQIKQQACDQLQELSDEHEKRINEAIAFGDSLSNELTSANNRREALESELTAAKKNFGRFQKQTEATKKQLIKATVDLEKSEEQVETAEVTAAMAQRAADAFEKSNQSQARRLREMQQEQAPLQSLSSNLQVENAQLKDQVDDLKMQIGGFSVLSQSAAAQVKALFEQSVTDINAGLALYQLPPICDACAGPLKRWVHTFNDALDQVKALLVKNHHLMADKEKANAEIQRFRATDLGQRDRINELERQVDELDWDLVMANSEAVKLTHLKHLAAVNPSLRNQIARLKSELEGTWDELSRDGAAGFMVARLHRENDDLRAELHTAHETAAQLRPLVDWHVRECMPKQDVHDDVVAAHFEVMDALNDRLADRSRECNALRKRLGLSMIRYALSRLSPVVARAGALALARDHGYELSDAEMEAITCDHNPEDPESWEDPEAEADDSLLSVADASVILGREPKAMECMSSKTWDRVGSDTRQFMNSGEVEETTQPAPYFEQSDSSSSTAVDSEENHMGGFSVAGSKDIETILAEMKADLRPRSFD